MTRDRLYGWLVILFASAAIAFGGLWQEERRRVAAYGDASSCWRVVRAEGPACADVTVGVTTHPMASVQGTVGSAAERDHLEKRLTEELGQEGRSRVRFGVRVRDASEADPNAKPGGGRQP
jgi:hypothetical protein